MTLSLILSVTQLGYICGAAMHRFVAPLHQCYDNVGTILGALQPHEVPML